MKQFECDTPQTCCGERCVVIISDDGTEPEKCPYEIWAKTKRKYIEWREVKKFERIRGMSGVWRRVVR